MTGKKKGEKRLERDVGAMQGWWSKIGGLFYSGEGIFGTENMCTKVTWEQCVDLVGMLLSCDMRGVLNRLCAAAHSHFRTVLTKKTNTNCARCEPVFRNFGISGSQRAQLSTA